MKFATKFVIAVALLMMSGITAWAQEASTVRITRIDGSVEVRKANSQSWSLAKEGDTLERGDRLAAKARSAAVIHWSNGSMVKIYPNTEIALPGVTFDLEKKLEKTLLDLAKGRMFVKAQVPDYLFSDWMVRMGKLALRTQSAEFAIKYDPVKESCTAWSLFGRLIAEDDTNIVRFDGGFMATISAGVKPGKSAVAPMGEKVKQSLTKVSKQLGGSLLFAEQVTRSVGGKLRVKIGGVTNRRGDAPYTVNFKALIKGGTGKLRSLVWDFGDGEIATTSQAEHTFTQGLYVVVLHVEDENGESASAQIGISVEEECSC